MSGRSLIGAMRHRLVHETPVEAPDGMGGVVRVFLAVDALWGAIETSAAPTVSADRPVAALTHRITVRAPAIIEPGDRLRLGERLFLIEALHDPDGSGRRLVCRCREERP